MAAFDLRFGRGGNSGGILGLVIPFEARVAWHASTDAAYYLVYPTEFSHGKPLEAFRAWLLEQAGAYAGIE